MPKPLSICLEFTDSGTSRSGPARFVRCVALAGGEPGLSVNAEGETLWMVPGGAFELWISGDERLILFRLEGAPGITVHRGGRSVDVPIRQPVVLLDQDEISWDGRCVRVHVHGEAREVHAPQPLLEILKAAGLVAALGTGLLAQGGAAPSGDKQPQQIEIRNRPPIMMPPRPKAKWTNQPAHKQLDAPARFLEIPLPDTSSGAVRSLLPGYRQVQVHVDVVGKPIVVETLPEVMYDELTRAIIQAVMQGRFEPGKKDGKAMEDWVDVYFYFPAQGKGKPSITSVPVPPEHPFWKATGLNPPTPQD